MALSIFAAGPCAADKIGSGGQVEEDCSFGCSILKSNIPCPAYTLPGTTITVQAYTYDGNYCCKQDGSKPGCKYPTKSSDTFSGECRLGTRVKVTTTYTSVGKVHCHYNLNTFLTNPYTVTTSQSNVSSNTTYCPKECTGGTFQYRVSGTCGYEARKCCSKGFWTDWGKTGCTSTGYVSGS